MDNPNRIEIPSEGDFVKNAKLALINHLSEELQFSAIDFSIEETYVEQYKDDDIGRVEGIQVNFEIDAASLDSDTRADIVDTLRQLGTNDKLAQQFDSKLDANLRAIEALSISNFIDIIRDLPGDAITIRELRDLINPSHDKQIDNEIRPFFRSLVKLYSSDLLDVWELKALANGEIRIPLRFVVKRIKDRTKAAQEVNNYRTFHEKKIETLFALNKSLVESEASAVFTLFEEMNILADEANLFSAQTRVFEAYMMQLAKMHITGLTHGDLHFNNAGYKSPSKEGTLPIILFDLTRSRIIPTGIENISLVSELRYFVTNLARALRTQFTVMSPADKSYALKAINQYQIQIDQHFREIITNPQEFRSFTYDINETFRPIKETLLR